MLKTLLLRLSLGYFLRTHSRIRETQLGVYLELSLEVCLDIFRHLELSTFMDLGVWNYGCGIRNFGLGFRVLDFRVLI